MNSSRSAFNKTNAQGEQGFLRVQGRRVFNEKDEQVFLPGVTGFALTGLACFNRDEAKRFIDHHAKNGIRIIRTTGMHGNGIGQGTSYGNLDPFLTPNYYNSLAWMQEYCAGAGIRLLHSILADCQPGELNYSNSMQQQLYRDTISLIGSSWNIIPELGNEWGKNGFDPLNFNRFTAPRINSRGSVGTDRQPFHPHWDIAHFEASRNDDFERHYKDVRDQYEGDNPDGSIPPYAFKCPVFIGEMIGISDVNEPGRSTNNPFKIWQYVAGCKIMGAPIVILHSRSGIYGRIPSIGGLEQGCLDAGVEASLLPLGLNFEGEYQRGWEPNRGQNPKLPVTHRDSKDYTDENGVFWSGDPKGSERTHAMIVGNRAEVIAPTDNDQYSQSDSGGWRTTQEFRYKDFPANVRVSER